MLIGHEAGWSHYHPSIGSREGKQELESWYKTWKPLTQWHASSCKALPPKAPQPSQSVINWRQIVQTQQSKGGILYSNDIVTVLLQLRYISSYEYLEAIW